MLISLGITLGHLAFVFLWPFSFLQLILGVPVLFFVPGYAIGALILGARRRLAVPESLAVVFGLSALFQSTLGITFGFVAIPLQPRYLVTPTAILAGAATLRLWVSRPDATSDDKSILRLLRAWTTFPSYSRRQKAAAYVIVALTFGALLSTVGLAFLIPPVPQDLQFALLGPDATAASLATTAAASSEIQVLVYIHNWQASGNLSLRLRVNSAMDNGSANYTQIPWVIPLHVGAGSEGSLGLNLAPGEIRSIPLQFTFSAKGTYYMRFDLIGPQGDAVRSLMLPLVIK